MPASLGQYSVGLYGKPVHLAPLPVAASTRHSLTKWSVLGKVRATVSLLTL